MSGDPFWHVIHQQRLDVPAVVLALHAGEGTRNYSGFADITRGESLLARLTLWLTGFPPAGRQVPTRLTISTWEGNSEWLRDFGGHSTLSRLSLAPAGEQVIERFGPVRLELSLRAAEGQLYFSVTGLRVFGVTIPRPLLPVSDTRETAGEDGCFQFDVSAHAPFMGLLIHYRGILRPVE